MTLLFSRAVIVAAIIGALAGGLNAGSALADDAARISRLESEIRLLRTQIDEQHRRIQRLEDELSRRTGGSPIPKVPEVRHDRTATIATEPRPWHSSEPWDRVTKGMSETEVTGILGEPTFSESMDPFMTLFYHALVAGSGPVSGHVNLRDGRVVAVNKPEFDK